MIDDDRSPDDMAVKFALGADVIHLASGKLARVGVPDDRLTRNALAFRRFGDLEVQQPDWLVRDIIEADGLALLIGDPGTGKSFSALDLAACIATGMPWHGHNCETGTGALHRRRRTEWTDPTPDGVGNRE